MTNFLDAASASALWSAIDSRDDWMQVINSGDTVYESSRHARAAMSPSQQAALDAAVYAGAREGFQFRYETIRVPDEEDARIASDDPLAAVAAAVSTGAIRDFFRTVTGTDAIDFADAQATSFSAGDFLTAHDDAVAGKNRHAAYVLGLTPDWRPEWGGLLLFHDDREISRAYVPSFNTLDLFRVPQRHSVSEVSQAAPCRRHAITGWLRSR